MIDNASVSSAEFRKMTNTDEPLIDILQGMKEKAKKGRISTQFCTGSSKVQVEGIS